MADFPRYFAFGDKYRAPNPYYRVDDGTHSVLVILRLPADQEIRVDRPLEYFLAEVECGELKAVTQRSVRAARSRWFGRLHPRW